MTNTTHPARRLRHGDRPTEPLTFDDAAANKAAEEGGHAMFEKWAANILGDNPEWRESGEGELARQAWQAAIAADRASRQVANKAKVEPAPIGYIGKGAVETLSESVSCKTHIMSESSGLWTVPIYLATPPATTGASTAPASIDPNKWAHVAYAEEGKLQWVTGRKFDACELYAPVSGSVGASTVLTDERIADTALQHSAGSMDAHWCFKHKNLLDFAREVAAQAGQVAVPEAVDGVRWDLFPGYLIDHCEGDQLSEELLQHALASMLKDSQYLAAIAAAPSPAKESK
jgi:hypothetical protein